MSEMDVRPMTRLPSFARRYFVDVFAILACVGSTAVAGELPTPDLSFKPVDLSTSHEDPAFEMIAEWFVRPMLKKGDGEAVSFAWARLDIDGDGYDELVLKLLEPSLCTDRLSCPVFVFRREDEGWQPILTVVSDLVWMRQEARGVALATRQGSIIHRWSWDASRVSLIPAR